MKIVDFNSIQKLNIPYMECVKWVEYAFSLKNSSKLPAKISLKLDNNVFFNTMPCYIPALERVGLKLVSRYPDRVPSLMSEILLYDSNSGECLALMNGDWITAMRTGAVAAHSIKVLQAKKGGTYSFIGLGNTARATLLCLLSIQPDVHHKVKLYSYKDQAESFIQRFSEFPNASFEIVGTTEKFVLDSDVIVSCVTAFDDIFAHDELYKEGILLVPVHTRGFQNCDLFFDKIIADDYDHVKDFKYFSHYNYFGEMADVITGKKEGRTTSKERIIAYNIGIALHDVVFASKIFDLLNQEVLSNAQLNSPEEKFWV